MCQSLLTLKVVPLQKFARALAELSFMIPQRVSQSARSIAVEETCAMEGKYQFQNTVSSATNVSLERVGITVPVS